MDYSERGFSLGPFPKTNSIIDFKNMFKPNYKDMSHIGRDSPSVVESVGPRSIVLLQLF